MLLRADARGARALCESACRVRGGESARATQQREYAQRAHLRVITMMLDNIDEFCLCAIITR